LGLAAPLLLGTAVLLGMAPVLAALVSGQSMIRKKPALGLDPRVETVFPKRSCSIKMLERQSIQSEAIAL
jgi:hypothetical protein